MLKRRDLYAMMVSYFAFGYTAYIYSVGSSLHGTARGLNLRTSAKGLHAAIHLMTSAASGGAISDRLTKSIASAPDVADWLLWLSCLRLCS